MAELTPMKKQYLEIKSQHPDCLLFFRLGDFYEMFDDDAKTAAAELNLTLTTRDRNKPPEQRTPMCGVPYHSSEAYISRLIAKGYKVAICEQTEDPAQAKGLVDREVIRVVTPGTLIEENMLEEGKNNFLAALYSGPQGAGLCLGDISTGEVFLTQFDPAGWQEHAINELARFSPREIILSPGACEEGLLDYLSAKLSCRVEHASEARFDLAAAQARVTQQFTVGLDQVPGDARPAIQAAGGLLSYLYETQKTDLSYLHTVQVLFHRPVFRAGPRGPAQPGADRDAPGQGEERLPPLGAGQDQDRHGRAAAPQLAGAAAARPRGHLPAAGRRGLAGGPFRGTGRADASSAGDHATWNGSSPASSTAPPGHGISWRWLPGCAACRSCKTICRISPPCSWPACGSSSRGYRT